MKYRKRPVVIDAIQFKGMDENKFEVAEFVKNSAQEVDFACHHPDIAIVTLEGTMIASPGDWVIKGIKGELYPCKPDIFDMTYEAVEDDNKPNVWQS